MIKHWVCGWQLYLMLILCVNLSPFHLQAQNNLILNPSCENASQIPDNLAGYNYCIDWWKPYIYSTDYFTSETLSNNDNYIPENRVGYQEVIDGHFYIGIDIVDWVYSSNDYWHYRADYAAGKFSSQLLENKIYQFKFWMSKAELGLLQSNALDLIITYDTIVDVNNFSDYGYKIWSEQTPMADTVNWLKVSTCFKAKGGEKAFVIGNFHNKEDVNIIFPSSHLSSVDFDYRYLDNFSLIECPKCCPELFSFTDELTVASNPVSEGYPIHFQAFLNVNTTAAMQLFDSAGRLVAERSFSTENKTAEISGLAPGMYHFSFSSSNGVHQTGKVIVSE